MSYMKHTHVIALLGFGLSAMYAAAAPAAVLSYEETASGRTGSGAATSYLTLPVSDTYTRTFTEPTTQFGGTGYGFYDDFVFTITGAVADAITSTIDLSKILEISDLSVRLYNFSGNPDLPVLGMPHGGAIDAWSQTLILAPGTNETVSVLPMTLLNAGTYVLEVRGNVTGSAGGSYTGSLNLVPTPLPAALPLLVSGIGLLGAAARRRARPTVV
jgi:hypothetical protein